MRASPERECDESRGQDDLGSHEGGSCGCQASGCEAWRRSRRSIDGKGTSGRQGGGKGASARRAMDLAPTIQELRAGGCEPLRSLHAPTLHPQSQQCQPSLGVQFWTTEAAICAANEYTA
jgi:hypothetical protein